MLDLCLRKGSKAPKEFEFILFVAENHWRKKEMGLKAMQYSDLKMVVLTCVEDEKILKKKDGLREEKGLHMSSYQSCTKYIQRFSRK